MREFCFNLKISAHEYVKYYQGIARAVYVKDKNGKSIQFPADVLKPFITKDGIYGYFIIRIDDRNKLIDIKKVAE
ncbi:MAG: DUF2835 domain-containing protein [Gammaproteobacteria bacterium]|nr:DUF2835 domain-containing protein [Gammaproteobacteria bacterium]